MLQTTSGNAPYDESGNNAVSGSGSRNGTDKVTSVIGNTHTHTLIKREISWTTVKLAKRPQYQTT